jgi:acylphosphatase
MIDKRAEFFISGTVQGVGFRYFVRKNAEPMGLKGFAKNLPDGRVQVVVEGNEDSIKRLHQKLKQGPSFSKVDKVNARFDEPKNEFHGFDTY